MGDKKIAIILGRGVEGCGVTKNAVEFKNYYKNSTIFAVDDKKWPRINSMEVERINFTCADNNATDWVIEQVNQNYDLVIVFSVPSVKHSPETVDNFIRMLRMITKPKSLVQVDHNFSSIARNAKLVEVCQNLDVLMTHSLSGAFSQWRTKNNITTPLITMGVGFNYEEHRRKFWKPIDEQVDHSLKWIGRCALWKGPVEIINLHNDYLRKESFITTLEGLEASVQSTLITHVDGATRKQTRDVQEFIRGANRTKARQHYGREVPGSAPYLYPDYKHFECMERLSCSAFGSDLYHLKPEFYGNNIEYCHAEVVASGTVPVFHKHFGDHIVHRKTGDKATAKFSGTIWYDPNDVKATADTIISLANDRIKRSEWRETAFEFWKEHSDAGSTYDDIISKTETAKQLPRESPRGLESFFA
jgi:hypothetical protein